MLFEIEREIVDEKELFVKAMMVLYPELITGKKNYDEILRIFRLHVHPFEKRIYDYFNELWDYERWDLGNNRDHVDIMEEAISYWIGNLSD